jgi:hypothetical protein
MTATTMEGHTSKTGRLGLLSLTALVIGWMIERQSSSLL